MKRIVSLVLISAILYGCGRASKPARDAVGGITEGVVQEMGKATGQLIGEQIVNLFRQEKLPTGISKQQALLQVASEINKSTPITVDKETVLVNVAAKAHALVYNYILSNYSSDKVNSNEFIKIMYPIVKNQACTNPDLKLFWRNNVSLYYSYSGNDGRFIGRLAISPSDCGY